MKRVLFAILILICIIANLLAQESDTTLKMQPAQITLVYPLGIFGVDAQNYAYSFSLNILAGRTGGTEGFEAGSLININDRFIKGCQVAGIGNLSFGTGEAFQAAGIFNLVKKDFTGFQGAGMINSTFGFSRAAQMAGIANYSNGVEGGQFAGMVNVSIDSVKGAQFAGIVNATTGYTEGCQGAGICNISEDVKGTQLAGIANVALNATGTQISGILNAAAKIQGLQLAGLINVAVAVEGVQLAGILNVCDSIDGVPFALFSFVRKNGYRCLEISSNEMCFINGTFKTGVNAFYTLFTIGSNPSEDAYNVSYGFGIGSSLKIKNTASSIDIELRCSQLTNDFETNSMLLHNSLIFDYSYEIVKHFTVFAGPTLNLLVADDPLEGIQAAPEWAMAYKYDNRLWGWLGFHAGLRF
jgi:hypothetical protein